MGARKAFIGGGRAVERWKSGGAEKVGRELYSGRLMVVEWRRSGAREAFIDEGDGERVKEMECEGGGYSRKWMCRVQRG